MTYLQKAVESAGGQAPLARKIREWNAARGIQCNVKQQHVWKWIRSTLPMPPAEHCRAIQSITGITIYQLRPDVFGSQPELDATRPRPIPIE